MAKQFIFRLIFPDKPKKIDIEINPTIQSDENSSTPNPIRLISLEKKLSIFPVIVKMFPGKREMSPASEKPGLGRLIIYIYP